MSKSAMHFEIALVEAIHEALIEGDDLFVPGLGTFSIDHQPAKIKTRLLGSQDTGASSDDKPDTQFATVIQPPENRISFVATGSIDDNFPEFKSR